MFFIFVLGIILAQMSTNNESAISKPTSMEAILDTSEDKVISNSTGAFAYTGIFPLNFISSLATKFKLSPVEYDNIKDVQTAVLSKEALLGLHAVNDELSLVYNNDIYIDELFSSKQLSVQLTDDQTVSIIKLQDEGSRFEIKAFIWVMLMIGLAAPLKFSNLLVISDRTDQRLDEYVVHHRSISSYLFGKSLSLGFIGLCSTLVLLLLSFSALVASLSVVLLNDPGLMMMASLKLEVFNTSLQSQSIWDDFYAVFSLITILIFSEQFFGLAFSYIFLVLSVSQLYLFVHLFFSKEVTASWLCSFIPYGLISIPFLISNDSASVSIPFLNIYHYISAIIDSNVTPSYLMLFIPNILFTLCFFCAVNFGLNRKIMYNFSSSTS